MSAAAPIAKLGKYEVRGTLGRGAMGTVYDGWDPVIHRRVAIKTIRVPHAGEPGTADELARFKREVQAAGRLIHPNIVSVFDYGETDEAAFIVMEFVDGQTLKDLLSGDARLSTATAVALMQEVLAGLAFSHERGVVHRDMKPANVMVTADGHAKIADFGIARIEQSELTQAGMVMGTPAYMSPEQFNGEVVDQRTDIYSCGVLLYQMLTGERPFEGSMSSIMHKAMTVTPPRPSELTVTAPPTLDGVVAQAMARRPEDRFATAAAFAQALRQPLPVPVPDSGGFATDETTMALRPVSHPVPEPSQDVTIPPQNMAGSSRSRRPLLLGGAAAVAVAVAVWAFIPTREPGHRQASLSRPVPGPVLPRVESAGPASAAAVEAALAVSLPTIQCSLVRAAVGADGSVALDGVAGAGHPQDAVRDAVAAARPTRSDGPVQGFAGPYCAALDVLRSHDTVGRTRGAAGIAQTGGPAALRDNDVISMQVTMPGFAGYLHMMYLQNDATVSPLVPGPGYPSQTYAAKARIDLGDPRPDFEGWHVGPPFGTDMIVAVATTAPLFTRPLPDTQPISAYLATLQAAIEALRQQGGSVAATAFVLETLPGR